MADKYLPYTRHTLDQADLDAVADALRSDNLTQGPHVRKFEETVAQHVGAQHAIAVSSGTAALHCACHAAGVGPGDEIVTSPITFMASGNCALHLGAKVRFVDIRPDTYTLDPEKLEAAISPRTKAIVPVDFTGQPADLDEINSVAKRHGIVVIEDAAHALGARYKDRSIGSCADMTVFSFHPAKHVAAGEGGMILTQDSGYRRRLSRFRNHGIAAVDEAMEMAAQAADRIDPRTINANPKTKAAWYYEMQELGFNYRITDIQCALALSQFAKLEASLARRRQIATEYTRRLRASRLLITPHQADDRESAWHLYMVRLRLDVMRKTRRQVFEEMRSRQIGVHVHYIPLHLMPYYRNAFGYKPGDFPVAEDYYASALTLPMFPAMTDQDVDRVASALLEIVEE